MKTHPKILQLKKLFQNHGIKIKSTYHSTISHNLITYTYDPINNYLNIRNCDRCNPCSLFHNNIKTLSIHFESIEKIETKLKHYGILPIQIIPTTRRTIPQAVNKVAQSESQNTKQNYTRLLG
jgi:hypothetical protein